MAVTDTNLWRGVHTSDMEVIETDEGPAEGVLYPTFERKKIGVDKATKKPRYREPDVTVQKGNVQTGGGTSLFDKDKFFKGKSWNFFYIPEGTEIDPVLKITGPGWNAYFEANHYQIEVAKACPVQTYKNALDHFARAAYAKRYVDART